MAYGRIPPKGYRVGPAIEQGKRMQRFPTPDELQRQFRRRKRLGPQRKLGRLDSLDRS